MFAALLTKVPKLFIHTYILDIRKCKLIYCLISRFLCQARAGTIEGAAHALIGAEARVPGALSGVFCHVAVFYPTTGALRPMTESLL